MNSVAISSLLVGVLAAVVSSSAEARPHAGPEARRPARPLGARVVDIGQRIDVNQISMVVTNTGSIAYDRQTGNAGLEYPKGSGKTAVFAAGPWLGAMVGGQVRLAISEYADEFGPGAMVGGVADLPDRPEYKVYKLERVYASTAERDEALADYNLGAVPHGAPVVTVLGDGTLSILGDQMLWCVFNDADPANHNLGSGTLPLGVEVQLTAFAYTQPGPPGPVTRTVFLRYKFLNKGANTLQDLRIGMWCDPDLGEFTDDLVGCDVSREVGYVYNSGSVDAIYGGAPPSVGVDLLRGPVGAGGVPLGMTAFTRYGNGQDPVDAVGVYSALRGLSSSGTPVSDPTTGLPTTLWVPGDPVSGTGWLDDAPSDRRMLLSSGPVDMAPGQSQEVDYAIVIGQGVNRLSSVLALRCNDDAIQAFFDRAFASPLPDEPECEQLVDCPRTAGYWYQQFVTGGPDFSASQLAEIARRVDTRSNFLDWAADPGANLIAALDPASATSPRTRAFREFAALLCNVAVSAPPIVPDQGQRVFLDPATPVACEGLDAQSVEQLAETAVRGLSDASYLDVAPNPPALVGVNVGMPLWGGAAGYAADLFGSSIPSGSPTHTVEIRFTGGAPGQYAYRYLRTLDPGGFRVYMIQDYVPVPWTVWDVETNTQLNGAFLENDGSPNQDGTWNPDDSPQGGRELVWAMDSPYSGNTPDPDYFTDPNLQDMLAGLVDLRYVMWPRQVAPGALIDDGDRFRFTWGGVVPGPGVDERLFELAALAPGDPAADAGYDDIGDCLAGINAGSGTTCDRPTPTLISLVGTSIGPDRVTVTWFAGGDEVPRVQVERREDVGGWTDMSEVTPDGRGFIEFEDTNVVPGHAYHYRLRWSGASGAEWGGETSVVVPLRDALSLQGFQPNPGGPVTQLAFTLRSSEPATLTVFDVAGRRRFARDVGALGPGPHVIPLEGDPLPSGIYLLHLAQGRRTVTRRAVAIR